jgi:hypothetical protein
VHLSGGRLYASIHNILYVYSESDLTSPIANYSLDEGNACCYGLIADNCLYIGGYTRIHVFEIT